MPQVVDLETLVCGGGGGGGGGTDGKIVYETTRAGPVDGEMSGEHLPWAYDPEQPAESFRLPFVDVKGWVDRSATALYDRDDSTKESTNPKSQHHHHQHNHNPSVKLHSSSQLYAAKAKAHIIGLPNKLQHSGYLGDSSRRHAATVRIFPKKISGDRRRGKLAVPETEPSSPKVSCFGRVLSDRDRIRRRKVHGEGPSGVSQEISHGSTASAGGRKRSGFLAAICAFSCCGQDTRSSATLAGEDLPPPATRTSTTKFKVTPSEAAAEDAGPAAPGLGGLKRFASGRRPASWGGDLELDGEFVTKSGPLLGKQQGKGILARRSVGALEDLDCDGNREHGGPASV